MACGHNKLCPYKGCCLFPRIRNSRFLQHTYKMYLLSGLKILILRPADCKSAGTVLCPYLPVSSDLQFRRNSATSGKRSYGRRLFAVWYAVVCNANGRISQEIIMKGKCIVIMSQRAVTDCNPRCYDVTLRSVPSSPMSRCKLLAVKALHQTVTLWQKTGILFI